MTKEDLAESITHGLFADRKTLREAFDYSYGLAESMKGDSLLVFTAIHVLLNTVANEIKKLEVK
jgi:cation transport regulator ChaB